MAVTVFNAVVQLCVLEIQPAFKRCLNILPTVKGHIQLTKCKRWKKVKPLLKLYLMDLLKVRIVEAPWLHSGETQAEVLFSNLYILFASVRLIFTDGMFLCVLSTVGAE
jgi:hypothetical protein